MKNRTWIVVLLLCLIALFCGLSISLLLLPPKACCSKKSLDKSVFVLFRNEKELPHTLKHSKMYFGRSNSFSAVIIFLQGNTFSFTVLTGIAVSNRKWYRENFFSLKRFG